MNKILVVIFVVLIFFGIFLFSTYQGNRRSERLRNDYPLMKYEHEVKGLVLYKYDFLNHGFRRSGFASCLNIDGKNYGVYAEEISNGVGIDNFVSVGDSIIKHSNNDTIYLIKKGRVSFLLRKDELYPKN